MAKRTKPSALHPIRNRSKDLKLRTLNDALPKIYPITDVRLSGISHAQQVEKLIAGGAKIIQLREKYASPRQFYASAAAALKIAHKNCIKIIINDRVDIALAIKADGVHLGQDDMPADKAREILGAKAIIGFSTHTAKQAAHALNLPVDYIAVGPIFQTESKEDPDKVVGLETFTKIRASVGGFPLVAIGGIDADNVEAVLSTGADAAAIIGALVSDSLKIEERMKHFTHLGGLA